MKFWEVLKAVDEGKIVQLYNNYSKAWITPPSDVASYTTNEANKMKWRIKPEPMVIYRNLYTYGFSDPIHYTPEGAKKGSFGGHGRVVDHFIRTVKFVEVMED